MESAAESVEQSHGVTTETESHSGWISQRHAVVVVRRGFHVAGGTARERSARMAEGAGEAGRRETLGRAEHVKQSRSTRVPPGGVGRRSQKRRCLSASSNGLQEREGA